MSRVLRACGIALALTVAGASWRAHAQATLGRAVFPDSHDQQTYRPLNARERAQFDLGRCSTHSGCVRETRALAGATVQSRWRTAPLWGLGYRLQHERSPTFLHDGRARTVEEAILWHGGEALTARERFEHLPRAERQALIAWIATL